MKVIINADDFGLSKSVNEAILKLCKLGTISSTSVMANMPYADEVVRVLEFEKISIGLHINFTQGKPVSNPNDIPSIVDDEGFFFQKNILVNKVRHNLVDFKDIEKELMAQYQKLYKLIGNKLTHFDSHQGSTRIKPIYKAVKSISKSINYKLPIRVHCKNYLVEQNDNIRVVEPNLFFLSDFGVKRVVLEYLFRFKRNLWRLNFTTPEGMLLAKDHKTITTLRLLANIDRLPQNNKVLEISVHPSNSVEDLEDTILINERVEEFDFLASDKFRNFISRNNIFSYKIFH